MNGKLYSEIISGIDDRHISSAASYSPFTQSSSEMAKPMRESKKKIFTLAVAACLVLALGITAYAFDIFGLRNISMDTAEGPMIIINAGKNRDAAEEWNTWCNENINTNQATSDTPANDIYWVYGAFSQAAKDKLQDVITQYGLQLYADRSQCGTVEELYRLLHADPFLPTPSVDETNIYSGGCDVLDGMAVNGFLSSTVLESGKSVNYIFYLMTDGYFMQPAIQLTDAAEYIEETYTVDDVEMTLALGTDRSYILADADGYSIAVYIRGGSENSNEALSSYQTNQLAMTDLEQFASSINFAAIAAIQQ